MLGLSTLPPSVSSPATERHSKSLKVLYSLEISIMFRLCHVQSLLDVQCLQVSYIFTLNGSDAKARL